MSRSEKVTFEGSTGETLSGIIDVPEGPVKGWGVFSHGFTLGKDSPSASRMCKALADSGVGMLTQDLRIQPIEDAQTLVPLGLIMRRGAPRSALAEACFALYQKSSTTS